MVEMKEKLMNRNFVLLWQGMAFSVFGDVLYSMAIGIWVYQKTGSEAWMGIFSSISMFTTMILMPFAGTFIDRWNKRNILVWCDAIRGVLMLVVGYIALTGNLTLELVLLVAFVAAICNVFFSPASLAMFTTVVAPKFLVQAQSLSNGTNSLIRLVGKGISGALTLALGVPMIILLNGISLLISAITEIFIQIPDVKKPQDVLSFKLVIRGMKEGFEYIIHHRSIAVLMLGAFLINLFLQGIFSLFLPFVQMKGMSLAQYGLLSSVASLAGLAGTLLMGIKQFDEKKQFHLMFSSMMVCAVLSSFGFVFTEGFIGLSLVLFGSQFANAIGNTILNAKLMLTIDEEIRGRAISIFIPFSQGGAAISSVLYGVFAETAGLYSVILAGGVLSTLTYVVLYFNQSLREIF